jgi:FkbM family methyltransferase
MIKFIKRLKNACLNLGQSRSIDPVAQTRAPERPSASLTAELTAPQVCYAQDGEDLVLDRLFEGQQSGFYVDIGAHHPSRFSNTYLFYLRGWTGINVDAQPDSIAAFNQHRPRDTNLEIGVGIKNEQARFFRFNEPALNTFNEGEAKFKDQHPYFIVDTQVVQIRRLDEILNEHMGTRTSIDFITIDVEGKDLEVLMSNDWLKYRPRFVLAESLRTTLKNIQNCPVVQFMNSVGYDAICKVYNTAFFERRT